MNWFSFILSLVAAIVPSVVSIVTVYLQFKNNKDNNNRLLEADKINNENKIKLKHLDYYYSEKSSIVGKYLENLINYLNNPSENNLLNYQISMAKASMYVSKKVYEEIEFIDQLINDNKLKTVKDNCLTDLVSSLCTENQQYK